MFCPKCKAEYVDGVKVCADCGCDLVDKLKGEEEFQEYVTIAETTNRFSIPIAKSILDAEGIHYFINGEFLNSYIGVGSLVQIQVPFEEAEDAKALLKDLDL